MDPITALGIAGNVVTFVDFAWTVLSEARTIYRSSDGASDEAGFLDTLVSDVRRQHNGLISDPTAPKDLLTLIDKSKRIASELLKALADLQAQPKRSKWKSFVAALKEVWGKNKTESLLNRLLNLQGQINSHLISATRNNVSDLSKAISTLQKTNERHQIESRDDLGLLKQELIAAVNGATAPDIENECLSTSPVGSGLKRLRTATTRLSEAAKEVRDDHDLLMRFYFYAIPTRHRRIESAHVDTFTWVYEDDPGPPVRRIRFREWLETENGVFWIHGKPGSGKSTLMKFLCHDERTSRHLHTWSQDKKLAIAKFFFWNAGTQLQRSQDGLLRSIIFEILRQAPELVPIARQTITDVTESEDEFDYESVKHLLRLYQAIVSEPSLPMKFCLFIDGLDEFQDGRQTHHDLLQTLRDMKFSSHIKLCVASRPWTVFEDEFQSNSDWSLKLEDLTRGDIARYVNDKFNGHSQFKTLIQHNTEYSSLVHDVTIRAQGVFLWVFLVMRELLEGLTYHDSIPTLRRRLEAFPPTLEAYFQKLVDQVPLVYHTQLARTFHIVSMTDEPLLALFYSFLDDVEEDPDFVSRLPVTPLEEEQMDRRIGQVRRRLDGRTRGLMEVVADTLSDFSDTQLPVVSVDVIHRTVRDFILDSPRVRSFVETHLPRGESASLLCCRATAALMKTAPSTGNYRLWGEYFFRMLFFFCPKAMDEGVADAQLVEVLEMAEKAYYLTTTRGREIRFLMAAGSIGFSPYIRKLLPANPDTLPPMTSILGFILGASVRSVRLSADVVALLLELGAEPNGDCAYGSPWTCSFRILKLGLQEVDELKQ